MEGPSIVIATHELNEFVGIKITNGSGSAKMDWNKFKGKKLIATHSWGKHLILVFEHISLRIHFLMFGSYRIDNPRENRIPKMQLSYKDHEIYFYSCAIKVVSKNILETYEFEADVMSPVWDEDLALNKVLKKPNSFICDILMNQEIFSGVGNIIKNEVLFNLKLHPELKVSDLSKKETRSLVKEASRYSHQFYQWKIDNVLKRNWKIFRKKTCPDCQTPVTKEETGVLKRISHYCKNCQRLKNNLLMANSVNHTSRVIGDEQGAIF